jgi:hypothetical protein
VCTPLLTRRSAPFRYLVESDSEQELFEGEVPRPQAAYKEPTIDFATNAKGKQVWIALDEAGEAWTSGLRGMPESSQVLLNEDQVGLLPPYTVLMLWQVGSLAQIEDGLVLSLSSTHLPLSHLYPLAEAVLKTLDPASFVLTEYSA